MFLNKAALSRSDFARHRIRQAFPLFLLCWLGVGALIYTGFWLIESSMQRNEKAFAGRLLDEILHFAAVDASFSLHSIPAELSAKMGSDYGFLHILSPQEELLFTTGGRHGGQEINFDILAAISFRANDAWLFLQTKDGSGLPPMTVVTRTLDNGIQLQLGRESLASWQLLTSIRTLFLFFFTVAGVISFLLSLLMVKATLSPLQATRERLKRLSSQSQGGLLPEQGNGSELDLLYCQINDLLRHNRRLIEEMQQSLDNVAHDLRTPLARLRSVAEYSLQEENSERLRDALADCLEESELILRILQVMMNVAEAESGTMQLQLEEKDLRQSIIRAVQTYQYVAEEKRISLEAELDKALPACVDETRITQVWANLLDNAIKYGRKDGWMRISGKEEAGGITISFADNGIGISAAEQQRIWERLYRGDRSRTEQGLGLGLCYVKAVVEAHGGRVDVISELHRGACFTVWLPRTEKRNNRSSAN